MPKPTLVKYKNGQEEALTFEPLSNTELYQFIDLLVAARSPEIVALCTRRTLEWYNQLDPVCAFRLAAQFVRENFTMAMRITMEDPIAGMKMGPLLAEMDRWLRLPAGPSSVSMPAASVITGSASPTAPAPAASPAPTSAPATATPLASSAGS
jgi:hypothetical protein